jgi:hypothetical protein
MIEKRHALVQAKNSSVFAGKIDWSASGPWSSVHLYHAAAEVTGLLRKALEGS